MHYKLTDCALQFKRLILSYLHQTRFALILFAL